MLFPRPGVALAPLFEMTQHNATTASKSADREQRHAHAARDRQAAGGHPQPQPRGRHGDGLLAGGQQPVRQQHGVGVNA
jgi:hypothetical protein